MILIIKNKKDREKKIFGRGKSNKLNGHVEKNIF